MSLLVRTGELAKLLHQIDSIIITTTAPGASKPKKHVAYIFKIHARARVLSFLSACINPGIIGFSAETAI